LIKYLMELGADPNLKNARGLTPIDVTDSENCVNLMKEYSRTN